MSEFIDLIFENLIYTYLPLLVAGMLVYRRLTSGLISLILLTAFAFFTNAIHDDWWRWALSFDTNLRHMAWYGVGFFLDALFVVALMASHWFLRRPIAAMANMMAIAFITTFCLNILAMANAFWVDSWIIERTYNYAIPAISVGVVLMAVYHLFKEILDVRSLSTISY